METFIPYTLNKACRDMDESKVPTLGPYARCLSLVLKMANSKRKDI